MYQIILFILEQPNQSILILGILLQPLNLSLKLKIDLLKLLDRPLLLFKFHLKFSYFQHDFSIIKFINNFDVDSQNSSRARKATRAAGFGA
jgi:hypothetical protein